MTEPADRLDLDRERDLGAILGDALGVFFKHVPVFLTLALVVVAPIVLVVDGIWGGLLADPKAEAPVAAVLTSAFLTGFVATALVTALHVRVVQALAAGRVLGTGEAFAAARPAFGLALGAVALTSLLTVAGFVLLIVPGIYLAIRLAFTAQAAVVDGRAPADALRESARLTKGRWWRTFGVLLVVQVLVGIATAIPAALLAATESGPIFVSGSAVFQSVALSVAAIAGTLLFFDTRVKADRAAGTFGPPVAAPPEDLTAPERPAPPSSAG